jgi:putative ABC transport system permease protein
MRRLLADAVQDLKHAARMLRRTRGFTAMAIAVIALGIGANTAVFSVVNAVLLEPLPYPESDRILQLVTTSRSVKVAPLVSIPKFNIWREEMVHVVEAMAAYQASDPGVNLTGGDRPEHLRAVHVSVDYFNVFGAQIRAGRAFRPAEDRPNGPRVAILSHGLWVRRFGSDPEIVGRTIQLGGETHEIVGVVAPGFSAEPPAELWLPLQADEFSRVHTNYVKVAARLRPSTTVTAARRSAAQATFPFRELYPFALGPWEELSAVPLRDVLVGDIRPSLRMLTGAVIFVLLIACANVASLLLARGYRRRREIATRAALGAPRSRLFRQLLTESLLLAVAGGTLGLAAGYAGMRALLVSAPTQIPRIAPDGSGITLDDRVLIFTVIVSVVTGILFGILPAIAASRTDLVSAFKDAGTASDGGWKRNRMQAALVVCEIVLALVLLVGAGLLIKTFIALGEVDRGFEPRNVLALDMSLNGTALQDSAAVAQMVVNATDRVAGAGGLASLAATRGLPFEASFGLPFAIDGRALNGVGGPYHGTAHWRSVTPEYFEVLRIRRLSGRTFTRLDTADAVPVAIINRAMARRYWQRNDPFRDRVRIGPTAGPDFEDRLRHLVGVVDDLRDDGENREPQPTIYVPLAQVSDRMTARVNRLFPLTFLVRTSGNPLDAAAPVTSELRSTSGGLPVARIRTMEQVVAASTRRAAFSMTLLTVFAAAALVLAVIGLYALMSHTVQQRTQEIGIRMALGAVPGDVRALVLAQGLRLAAVGVLIGIGAALVLTRLMVNLVFGVQTYDPGVLGSVVALLATVALAAAYIPARRATRVSPLDALRS